jgi:hypothetical protein
MIFSGNSYRSVVNQNKFSADLSLSVNCCTGTSEIGFSGQGKTFKFSLVSGKVIDPEGRLCSSYLPNTQFSIYANFSGQSYNYAVNDSYVTYSGLKQDFYAEKFYVNNTGNVLDANVILNTNKPSLSFSAPTTFITGQSITGYLTSNFASGVKVFSGYFENGSSFTFSSAPSGLVSASNSGQFLINQTYPRLGYFSSDFYLDTSAGRYQQNFSSSGLAYPYLNYAFSFVDGSDSIKNVSSVQLNTGVTKFGSTVLNYGYFTNYQNLAPASLPLYVSLEYVSGRTGQYGLVSDVSVASGGNGYTAPPYVLFSGGGGSFASGVAILGASSSDYDKVVSVNMTSYGSGYTSAPSVIFSGGTGVINNNNPSLASGSASIVSYAKSFSGCFGVSTGIGASFTDFLTNNQISGSKYYGSSSLLSNSSVNLSVSYKTTFDTDPLYALLTVSGVAGNVIQRNITGIK